MNAETQSIETNTETRLRLRNLMDSDKRLSQARVAQEVGISAATLSQWMSGAYGGNNDAIEAKVLRWVDLAEETREQARMMPAAPEYVTTPSSQRVVGALRYAQMAGDIAVVYGGAGLSKSSAISHYAKTAPNVFVTTMTPASAGVVTSLAEIAESVGASVTSGGAAKLHKAIVRRLLNTNGLLVLDEAQHLSTEALDQVRSLHDATGIGLAMVGNEEVYARMTGGNRAAYLDRLFSRVGKKVRLAKATLGDIEALLDAWKVGDRKTRELLADIASKPGALRIMTKVLRLASMYAAGDQRTLSTDDVRAAWHELGGVA